MQTNNNISRVESEIKVDEMKVDESVSQHSYTFFMKNGYVELPRFRDISKLCPIEKNEYPIRVFRIESTGSQTELFPGMFSMKRENFELKVCLAGAYILTRFTEEYISEKENAIIQYILSEFPDLGKFTF